MAGRGAAVTAQLWSVLAGVALTALGALAASAITYFGGRKAAIAVREVEDRRLDREEFDSYVTQIRADLAYKGVEMDRLRDRLVAEETRTHGLRDELRRCLAEADRISADLRRVRAELEEEQRITEPMRAQIVFLQTQIKHLRDRLRDAGLDPEG